MGAVLLNPEPWGNLSGFRAAGEGLSDAIQARIATNNRVQRGGVADPDMGAMMMDWANNLEAQYRTMLMSHYELRVPEEIRDWARTIPGLASGELFPRILGFIGHPCVAVPYMWVEGERHKRELVSAGPPFVRSVRQLWQYCGVGDPESNPKYLTKPTQEQLLRAGKRRQVRPLLYTLTSYLVRAHTRSEAVANSKYYQLYVSTKEQYAEHVHIRECRNKKRPPMASNGCGTVLHPEWGEVGSPWRPGHINAHGHRIVQKAFLGDLWDVCNKYLDSRFPDQDELARKIAPGLAE